MFTNFHLNLNQKESRWLKCFTSLTFDLQLFQSAANGQHLEILSFSLCRSGTPGHHRLVVFAFNKKRNKGINNVLSFITTETLKAKKVGKEKKVSLIKASELLHMFYRQWNRLKNFCAKRDNFFVYCWNSDFSHWRVQKGVKTFTFSSGWVSA